MNAYIKNYLIILYHVKMIVFLYKNLQIDINYCSSFIRDSSC